jgi:hypothetical protein
MKPVVFALLVALALAGRAARAQELPPAVQPAPPPAAAPAWYGWQILIADAAVASTLVAADQTGDTKLDPLVVLGYLVAAPAIHGAHGRAWSAGSSVLLRIGVPAVTALVGFLVATGTCSQPSSPQNAEISIGPCEGEGAYIGLFGGMAAVSIFDIARAWQTPGEVEWRPNRGAGFAWTPLVAPTSSGATLGMVGRF